MSNLLLHVLRRIDDPDIKQEVEPLRFIEAVVPGHLAALRVPEYQHPEPLQGRQIRLIRLERIADDGLMYFSIRVTNLPANTDENATPYVALSYTWDSWTQMKPIIVQGARVMVSKNCHRALMDLYNDIRLDDIWVDAVCTDQRNEKEKDHQLNLIRHIYEHAIRVYIFLGHRADYSDDAMYDMREIGQFAMKKGVTMVTPEIMRSWPKFLDLRNEELVTATGVSTGLNRVLVRYTAGHFKEGITNRKAIMAILARSWFNSPWHVQELSRCQPRKIIFACGAERASWKHVWATAVVFDIYMADKLFRSQELAESRPRKKVTVYSMVKRYSWLAGTNATFTGTRASAMMRMQRRIWGAEEVDNSLKNMLIYYYVGDLLEPMDCSDPRDRILAVQDIVSAEDQLWLKPMTRSTKDWKILYRDVARTLICKGHIDLLSLCRDDDPNWPTWVPRWGKLIRAPWNGLNDNRGVPGDERLYDTGGKTTVHVLQDPFNRDSLIVGGFFLDVIVGRSYEWTASIEKSFDWQRARRHLRDIREMVRASPRYLGEKEREGEWRIPTGDKEFNPSGKSMRATKKSLFGHRTVSSALESSDPGSVFDPAFGASYLAMMNTMYQSRPFKSQSGFVGLCPATCVVGDRIFVPSGSHTPYCIRRVHARENADLEPGAILESWRLQGEAFVYGVMDGELRLEDKLKEMRYVRLV